MNIFEKKPDSSKSTEKNPEEGPSLKEQKKAAFEVRNGLLNFFEKEFASLGEVLVHRMKKAVVDGNFRPVYELIETLKNETDKMKGNYENYWKDLGPDKKQPTGDIADTLEYF